LGAIKADVAETPRRENKARAANFMMDGWMDG
jgi:hypothetical protein